MNLAKLDEYLKMKECSIQVPNFYLGVKPNNTVLKNCVVTWVMSSSNNVQSDVQNMHEYLKAVPGIKKLLKKAPDQSTGVIILSLMIVLS
jgi:hypothetical protein